MGRTGAGVRGGGNDPVELRSAFVTLFPYVPGVSLKSAAIATVGFVAWIHRHPVGKHVHMLEWRFLKQWASLHGFEEFEPQQHCHLEACAFESLANKLFGPIERRVGDDAIDDMLRCRYEEVGDITIPSVYHIRRVNVIARSFKNLRNRTVATARLPDGLPESLLLQERQYGLSRRDIEIVWITGLGNNRIGWFRQNVSHIHGRVRLEAFVVRLIVSAHWARYRAAITFGSQCERHVWAG